MPLYGSHLSIAGGYFKAADKARELGLDALQIFTKNNNQWRAKPLETAEVERFHTSVAEAAVTVVSHNSYLINLASGDDDLRQRSIDAMVVELERAHALGIGTVVAHPGSHGGDGEEVGLVRIAESLLSILQRTATLPTAIALETTAGQGNSLGYRFEQLRELIERCEGSPRVRTCLDTCHIFAAGYPLAPRRKYLATMRSFEAAVGWDRLACLHLNDSKRELGSRVDRHEHIGEGHLGLEPFRHVVNDPRLTHLPMILETAKEDHPETGEPWDVVNLRVLRSLEMRTRRSS